MNKKRVRFISYVLSVIIILCSVELPVFADDDLVLPVLDYDTDMECYIAESITDYVEDQDAITYGADNSEVTLFSYEEYSEESDYWDSFSTDYFYNQLQNDYEREFWKGLERACDQVLYTTGGVKEVTLSGGGVMYSTNRVTLYGGDSNRAKEILKLFYGSKPQYYFIENGYISYGNSYCYAIYNDFVSSSARVSATAEYKKAIDSSISKISRTTDLETIKQIHDYVCRLTEYNNDAVGQSVDEEITKSQSGYSCLVMHSTVCSGYAHTTQLLCNYFDIDSIEVFSNGHAWNAVKCDNNWYQIDTTWADQSWGIYYGYFMKSYSDYQVKASHVAYSWMYNWLPPATLNSTIPSVYSGANITIPSITQVIGCSYTVYEEYDSYNLEIIPADSNAEIYYTLDGAAPDEAKTKCYKYTDQLEFNSLKDLNQVRFIVVCDGYWDSAVVNVSYVSDSLSVRTSGYQSKIDDGDIIYYRVFLLEVDDYNNSNITVKVSDSLASEHEYKMSELRANYNATTGLYEVYVPLHVVPKEMGESLTIQFYKDGITATEIFEQKYVDYLNYIIDTSSKESVEYNVAYNLATLGDASQKYFGYNLSNPIMEYTGIHADSTTVRDSAIISNLRAHHKSSFNDYSDDLDYIGTSLSLKDYVTINYYFTVSDDFDMNALSISTSSDKVFTINKVGGNVMRVSMSDVRYTDVKKVFQFDMHYKKSLAMKIDYSMGDYIAAVLSDSTKDPSLRTLCRAMYTLTE